MAPFAIVAIVAGSLFTSGTVVKEVADPTIGTAMQYGAVGALVGGATTAAVGAAVAPSKKAK